VAGIIERLPGMRGAAAEHFSHHRDRVSRIREAAQNYREEAKDAFDHYSSNNSDRQSQLVNVLTVVAMLYLP
jgi:Mg2+ and Co2+ transporter CorA